MNCSYTEFINLCKC